MEEGNEQQDHKHYMKEALKMVTCFRGFAAQYLTQQ